MANHDDFLDDYIGYQIFEDSMKKGSGGGKTPKRNTGGSGCPFWLIIIIILALAPSALGSCGKSSSKYSSGSYRSSYSTSSHTSTNRSNSSGSSYSKGSSSSMSYPSSSSKSYSGNSFGNKSKSSSSDPYDTKSYAHPEDLYYDYPDDFWDYDDAEEYWEEHQDD